LSPSTFIKYYTKLGNAFQPDSNETTIVSSLILSFALNSTLMGSKTQDNFFFGTLSDLAMFYPFGQYSTNLTSWILNGGSLLIEMKNARDPNINQMCQVGLTNTANYTNIFNSYQNVFATQYVNLVNPSSSSKRKRRSNNYIFTCTDLTNIGAGGVSSLTSSQLSSISLQDFYSCQTLLGLAINSWSSSQLAALATLAKSVRQFIFMYFNYILIKSNHNNSIMVVLQILVIQI